MHTYWLSNACIISSKTLSFLPSHFLQQLSAFVILRERPAGNRGHMTEIALGNSMYGIVVLLWQLTLRYPLFLMSFINYSYMYLSSHEYNIVFTQNKNIRESKSKKWLKTCNNPSTSQIAKMEEFSLSPPPLCTAHSITWKCIFLHVHPKTVRVITSLSPPRSLPLASAHSTITTTHNCIACMLRTTWCMT